MAGCLFTRTPTNSFQSSNTLDRCLSSYHIVLIYRNFGNFHHSVYIHVYSLVNGTTKITNTKYLRNEN